MVLGARDRARHARRATPRSWRARSDPGGRRRRDVTRPSSARRPRGRRRAARRGRRRPERAGASSGRTSAPRRYAAFTARLRGREGASGRPHDGVRVELLANVELEVEVAHRGQQGAEGDRPLPHRVPLPRPHRAPERGRADRALPASRRRMAPRPVTSSAPSISGADKVPPLGRVGTGLGRAPNPALGLRGLRLSLACPDLLRVPAPRDDARRRDRPGAGDVPDGVHRRRAARGGRARRAKARASSRPRGSRTARSRSAR